MNRPRNLAFEAWVDEARAQDILAAAVARGAQLRGGAVEKVGPCPACGGRDRFSVNMRKRVFHCRHGQRGGDVIAMVEYLDGVDFIKACEILTGRPPPRGEAMSDAARAQLAREQEERRAQAAAQEKTKNQAQEHYRLEERKKAHRAWNAAGPAAGSAVEQYLEKRGLVLPARAHLRCAPKYPFFMPAGRGFRKLGAAPAMLAAITGPDGAFMGLHQTWIGLSQANGKAVFTCPETGEVQPSKKIRGSHRGGKIELVRVDEPVRLFVGEGIETVLSVWLALLDAGSPLVKGAAFWSGVSLGNMAGPAVESVTHPTATRTDKAGRARRVKVPGEQPDMSAPAIPVPDSVSELFLLGDGDSETFFTRMALKRAARRFAQTGRVVRAAWAAPGGDFNDMLMEGADG